jgi:hypothetical protein
VNTLSSISLSLPRIQSAELYAVWLIINYEQSGNVEAVGFDLCTVHKEADSDGIRFVLPDAKNDI